MENLKGRGRSKNRQIQAHISTCTQQRTYRKYNIKSCLLCRQQIQTFSSKWRHRINSKSYDPDDDPNEPWKLTSTRIDSIKENDAVRAQISNGKPGKKVFFQLTGNGLDKNDIDLSYGRMKGKPKMDKDGYAVIPFTIRTDHKTEGTETF